MLHCLGELSSWLIALPLARRLVVMTRPPLLCTGDLVLGMPDGGVITLFATVRKLAQPHTGKFTNSSPSYRQPQDSGTMM